MLIKREVMKRATNHGRIDTMVGIPDNEGMPVVYEDLTQHRGHSTTSGSRVHPVDADAAGLGRVRSSLLFTVSTTPRHR